MFLELQNIGWNLLSLSLVATISFSMTGAWGIAKQAKNILATRSGASVNTKWNIVFAIMYATWFVYGAETHSMAIMVQSIMRVPFIAIVLVRLWQFKGYTRSEISMVVLFTSAFLVVSTTVYIDTAFTIVSYLGAAAASLQPLEIWKKRSVGVVSIEMMWIYLASVMFWLFYGLVAHDMRVFGMSIPYITIYSTTIGLYYHFRNNPNN